VTWDWQEILVALAIALAAGALWEISKLKEFVHIAEFSETRKWRKSVIGPRHVPRHKPDQVPQNSTNDDRLFFQEFEKVSDRLNRIYEDEPWSFENTGRLKATGFDEFAEREILVRYNNQNTGSIKVRAISYREAGLEQQFKFELELINARWFSADQVFGLAYSVGTLVAGTADEVKGVEQVVSQAMIRTMWQVGDLAIGNPSLEVEFSGSASKFLEWSRKQIGTH
jgi:hypothetical protein